MRGVLQIVRFNWPLYVAGAIVCAASLMVMPFVPGTWGGPTLAIGAGVAMFWTAASLIASWVVYDWSPLMRWRWLGDVLRSTPRSWINIHAGLDESTTALRRVFGEADVAPTCSGDVTAGSGRVFDIFDPVVMTEPSIARARHDSIGVAPAEAVDFRRLPAVSASADAVLLLMSAHELRDARDREALFAEVRRVLAPGGRAIVAEHLRDAANFAAFGPGAFHFHSRRTWTSCFAAARLTIERELTITPFVHVFILTRCA
jgi:SAM-dependent methyltransferase